MEFVPAISQIATLLADPKRSAMLWALIDGTARGSEELASLVGLSTSSAGAHLARLSAGGLLKREARGRKRFFRLATPEVGAAVEALASVSVISAETQLADAAYSAAPRSPAGMRRARVCQEHLGGELAADLYQRMLGNGWIEQTDKHLEVSPKGSVQLARAGIYTQALAQNARTAVCACCDWSSRRPHVGGALGASLMKLFLQSGWLKVHEDSRALQVTPAGLREITRLGSQG